MMRLAKLKFILAGLVLVLAIFLKPAVALADDAGAAEGEFEVGNAAPTVDSVKLWIAGGSETSIMTPQLEYNIKVDVTDVNTLDNLSTITVRIFYDASGNYTAGEEAGAAHNQTRAILTWTNGGSWSIDPSNGTSWELVSDNCQAPSLSGDSGIFEFHFKPGKVATETTGSDKWHIYAEAVDDSAATANNTDQDNNMNWYGEIAVNTGKVDWGPLAPGINFGEASSNWTGISITYTANGAYDEEIAASAIWTGNSDNATLDASGNCTNSNEFSLKADNITNLENAELVTASPAYATIDDTGTQTGESGDTVTTNTLWLKLSSVFVAETYSGSIHFKIADGS